MNKKRWLIVASIVFVVVLAVVIYKWPKHISDICDTESLIGLEFVVRFVGDKNDKYDVNSLSGYYNIKDKSLIEDFLKILEQYTFRRMIYLKLNNDIPMTLIQEDTVSYDIGLDATINELEYTNIRLFTNQGYCTITKDFTNNYEFWFTEVNAIADAIDSFILKHQLKPKYDEPYRGF